MLIGSPVKSEFSIVKSQTSYNRVTNPIRVMNLFGFRSVSSIWDILFGLPGTITLFVTATIYILCLITDTSLFCVDFCAVKC